MKFNVLALALTLGLFWGVMIFLVTWWIILFEGQTHAIPTLGHIYRGYNISALGSVYGLIWGLCDGFVGGLIFGWLYNLLARPARQTA